MTDNWWRCGSRSTDQFETRGETAWPILSPSKRRPINRRKTRGPVPAGDEIVEMMMRKQTRSGDRSSVLDDEGYPRLGERLSKRKLSGSLNPLPGCSGDPNLEIMNLGVREEAGIDGERARGKLSKKPRSIELVCIDFKKALERQRSLSESKTSSTPKPRIKLNLNLSIRNPLDSARVIQCRKGIQREVPRAKRISKLKRVIFREREYRRQTENIWKREIFDVERIRAVTKDVSEIDFNRLKISGEQKPEVTFVRDMSGMSLFDKKHRNPTSDNIPDDCIPESNARNDVVSKLENLLIQRDRDVTTETDTGQEVYSENEDCEYPMDSEILAKTLCLKICDETGETVEEFYDDTEAAISDADGTPEIGQNPPKHSRNFREYCTNDLTPGLNKASEKFLAEIYRLQKRMYQRDEVKGRCRRRFYAGFKEVLKHVESKKIRFVFIAPDLEGIRDFPGGLDEFVNKLITACKLNEIVFCFSLNKRKLGYFTHKKGSVSCVGITNYAGLEDLFKDVLAELMLARNSYGRLPSPVEYSEILNPSNETLLSARINLLFKSLTITGSCS